MSSTSPSQTANVKPVKYLVCVDARPEAQAALRLAAAKAGARGGIVDMIHVIPPADFQTFNAVAERMLEERRAEAETLLKQRAEEINAAYGLMPSFSLREGQIGEEILAAAMEDIDVGMLVLGVAVQGASRGSLINWLASHLGTKLFIPLLLVPGNLTDQQLQALV